jgi:integrase
MAKFNLNLREPDSESETAIHLVIRWNNNRMVYPTKESIEPGFWENDKTKRNFQRAIETRRFPTYPEFNARLDDVANRAKDVFRRFSNDNKREPNIDELRSLLNIEFNRESPKDKLTLFKFIEQFIEQTKTRINPKSGQTINQRTVQKYNTTFDLLKDFQKKTKRKVDFDSISLDFYYDLSTYLMQERNYATNTVGKHIQTLKVFLNAAIDSGINKNIAHKSSRFKVVSEQSDSIYLSEKELEDLYNLDLSNNSRLERVRDLFIVGCWTGLRFSDFSDIKPENINNNFITVKTKKTGESVVIPIHKTVMEIMKKYKSRYPNSLPPAISNVKMNLYLKEFGNKEFKNKVECLHVTTPISITKGGLNVSTNYKKHELITTHTARRSFATNLYLSEFPAISIMKIAGHRTEKAFMKYIKITPDENAKLLHLHWENKNKLKIA